MKKHSVILKGHATSVSLEETFWQHLKRIAKEQQKTLQCLIEEADESAPQNLSSELRLLVLHDLEQKSGLSNAN